jgi:hypothetical protein
MKCTLSLTSEKDILKFFDFLLEHNLWETLSIDGAPSHPLFQSVTHPSPPDTTFYTPTPLCKEMCGSEWLNPKGLLSRATALEFLHHQIQLRNLPINNGFLQTDEWFRTLFQDGRDCVPMLELPLLTEKLFLVDPSSS